jgi:hypothetical protein
MPGRQTQGKPYGSAITKALSLKGEFIPYTNDFSKRIPRCEIRAGA